MKKLSYLLNKSWKNLFALSDSKSFLGVLVLLASSIMCYAFWKERRVVMISDEQEPLKAATLGEGDYEMSMIGTIGDLVKNNNLQHYKLAIWGGEQTTGHGLPFRYRVSADWFMLPQKPISILSNDQQMLDYDFILSPWEIFNGRQSEKPRLKLVSDENRVWLYQVIK